MTPEETKTSDRMKSVKAAWDKAPSGPKKDESLRHYRAAETAHFDHDEAETNKALDSARHALA